MSELNGSDVNGRVFMVTPMKPLREAKSRLDGALDMPSKCALSMLMLDHVLHESRRSTFISARYIVGGDPVVRRLAESGSCTWLPDPDGDLNSAVRHGAHTAFQDGADAVLVLPGDLGLVNVAEIDSLIEASDGLRHVVLCRALRDGGTNAMLVPRGQLVGPIFGPDSFTLHLEAMRQAGIQVKTLQRPGLEFDLDTAEDLAYYRTQRPELTTDLDVWRRRLATEVMTPVGREWKEQE